MGVSIGIHPNYGEQNQEWKFKARVGGYNHDDKTVYVDLACSNNNSVAFHGVDVNDLLELSAVLAEATVKAQQILKPVNPEPVSDDLAELDAASEPAPSSDLERNLRLANAAEQLLMYCKRTLVPPPGVEMGNVNDYLEWTEQSALALIRLVEPETPEDLEEGRTFIAAEFAQRSAQAVSVSKQTGFTGEYDDSTD